jgi:hypothetical protein
VVYIRPLMSGTPALRDVAGSLLVNLEDSPVCLATPARVWNHPGDIQDCKRPFLVAEND